MKKFLSPHLIEKLVETVSTRKRWLKRILFILGIVFLIIGLARPQWGFRWDEMKQQGVDIMIAFDVSKSMLAQDVKPSRLVRAKLAVTDFITQLKGDRIGLIAFAGNAFLQCPLTLDYEILLQTLDTFDVNLIPHGGTNISGAIAETINAFQTLPSNHKILILITDGEDLAGEALKSAQEAGREGLRIFTVGVGTATGEIIPIQDESGGTQFVRDDKGQIVKSHLDEDALKKIAEAAGGFYAPLGQQGEGLQQVYQHIMQNFSKQDLSSRMQRNYIDRYQWFLGVGLVFLILELLINDRKKIKTPKISANNVAKQLLIIGLVFLNSSAFASVEQAEKAYTNQKYAESVRQYRKEFDRNSKDPRLAYNLGSAVYKLEQYQDAAKYFEQSLHTDKTDLQQKAYYNLGNAYYRLGEPFEKKKPEQAIQLWQQSVQNYESSLKLKPDDEDAKFNRDFVLKKLQKLQEQQKKDQKEQQNPQNQKQDEEKKKQEQQNQQQQQNGKQQSQSSQMQEASGQLTKGQAEKLLDALKGEDAKREPVRGDSIPLNDELQKDW